MLSAVFDLGFNLDFVAKIPLSLEQERTYSFRVVHNDVWIIVMCFNLLQPFWVTQRLL